MIFVVWSCHTQANVTVTPAAGLCVNNSPGTYTTISNIVIIEGSMDDFAAQRLRNEEGSTIDRGAGRSCDDGGDVADVAPDPREQALADERRRRRRQDCVARRHLGAANELCEVIDVG